MKVALPLTPMQQGMLFQTLREPAGGHYLQQLVVRLCGPVDSGALARAWNTMLGRHEALRLGAEWRDAGPVALFAPADATMPFAEVDHRASQPQEEDALRAAFLATDRARGFALDHPPLMRVALLRWPGERCDLVWSHHHVLVDGWSSGLVLAELMQEYQAQLQGRSAALPPVPAFREFLHWLGQRDVLAAEAYWRDVLNGFEQATPLTAMKRPGTVAGEAQQVALDAHVDAAQWKSLCELARQAGVSQATVVIACWGLLLARHADTQDVVFGITTAGRPASLGGADGMVGLFINTIPLRMGAAPSASIAEWLALAQRRLADARAHEHTALTRIAEWSAVPAGQPLFHSLVAFENYPLAVTGSHLGAAAIEGVQLEERPSVALALLAEPGARGLALRLLVDATRVDAAAARAMLDQLAWLLEQLASADPRDAVQRLALLRPHETGQIVQGWNATAQPYDRQATLPSLFAAQAQRTPDAVALIDGAGELSYAALRARVARLVAALDALALAPGSPVAVRMGRDRELVVALLAVVSAGHYYVPIETQWPAARVDAILEVLPIRCLLTDARHLEGSKSVVGARPMSFVAVDALSETGTKPLEVRPSPGDTAYVIFTSGSTGKPKGVLVKHTKAVNLIEWVNKTLAVGPADRLLFVTSPAFDLSVYDVFGMLAAGGCVRVASEVELQDPQRLVDLLVDGGITFWDSAPAALWQLAPLFPSRATASALRLVFMSGDWIPLPLPPLLQQVFPHVKVVALGGATEATVWSNFHVVKGIDPAWVSVPYGRPIQNARYYVLDSGLAPCPIGVPGDLYIGGECLAEGYVGQPELTAERFIADPFCALAGARMYRTGDRARFDSNGVMEFLGRLDTQVKVRGFRIELGEIEVAMRAHPAVQDAIAIVHDAGAGGPAGGKADPQVVGYFVLRPGERCSGDELHHHLGKVLPAPMVPAFLLAIDAIPVSANGKVDRKNLPRPDAKTSVGGQATSGDMLRDTIAAIWCEVLVRDAVGHDDDFFAIGGHSLRATSVVARMRAALGLEVPLRLIFEQPTVRGMAEAVRALAPGGLATASRDIPRRVEADGWPLSRAASRLWFLHQLEPASANYNVALAARLTGSLAADAMQRAAATVIARHVVLDSLVVGREGQPRMLRADRSLAMPFTRADLGHLPAVERDAEALRQLTAAARVPFALDRERPVRVHLFTSGAQVAHVLILMDHIATDGWSIALFAEELLRAYDAERGQGLSPPPPELQYPDFSAWWDALVERDLVAHELAYWKEQLRGLQPLVLKSDVPAAEARSGAGARLQFSLAGALSERLRRLAQQQSATLFMVLLAAFEVVLRRRSGQDEVVVGTDIAGRDHPAAEQLIGFFVNQLVLRTDFAGSVSFADMLERVRACTLQAFFHQHVPFDVLVRECNPERDSGRMPLFQHKLVLQNAPMARLARSDLRIDAIELDTGTAKYELLLTLIDEDALRGTLEYSTDLFQAAAAQELLREFRAVLEQVAADATVSYDSLCRLLATDEDARAEAARKELRRSGLQRLRAMARPGATP